MCNLNDSRKYFNIPYIKLKISIIFPEDAILPANKVSALRGGMGEMILRSNCIKDRKCEECYFERDCIVRRTVYTQMEKKPDFMQGNDSVGYLIECENYQEEFAAGEGMYFYLILFGKNLVYFSQYLQAFYQLGNWGIGKYNSRFMIQDIYTSRNLPLVMGNEVKMDNYQYETIAQYVGRRMKQIEKYGCKDKVKFLTPFSVKYHGEYIQQFQTEAIFQSIFRRLTMLNYFVGHYEEVPVMKEYPEIISQNCWKTSVGRYSSTHNSKIILTGLKGELQFESVPEEYYPYLLAGELIHIGKNSSFGFGKYIFY